eukprot:CAMPEP_0185597160 /NCGR_PEP_ID=MMETSP0434-20130131/81188_1 /TAXON_ID=626734 ORGANISM="Favella taraikaensis, Strain Fe Narragansett Bay" /NCGR_SAMPLE_ID=MMETSP0434 /ASSEMBLY_ACC=CAM_ASM_000379 /LENGTH=131 /DNA_ID=CAMNT_0028225805 /DNA_START=1343 /DNA_END=1738 /DNA_ORIENTATION=+
MNRKRFFFEWAELAKYLCCKRCSDKKLAKKAKVFERASKRLGKDLDVAKLVADRRQNEMTKELIFDKREQYLLQFIKKAVIVSSSGSENVVKELAKKTAWHKLVGKAKRSEKTKQFEKLTKSVLNGYLQKP